ncbi:T9SS type A sorting domain-containing protein [Flavobacterium amniphilum]|uniref:T9SS type A sorting domain-containing protein n=1 Tax=Flavobacterium amniphilum TaxID=1834035 RepID=UPI00202A4801|nr:T9SS type A sorting domain-containing protein [Flavobacterium amniphilum]MCL9804458.1 T9SS type A sorting domain-containing protein [Flavobacterium amniphilum]
MKKTVQVVVTIFLILSNTFSYSQKSNKTIGSAGTLTEYDSYKKASNPCTFNGVEITSTGSYPDHAYIPPTVANGCFSMAFDGDQPWTGHSATGFITYTFSEPVINATIGYAVVNSQDVGQITIDGASPVYLSNPCGVNIIGPDRIQGNFPNNADNSDITITVSSATPFTTITLTNISADSGWVSGNLCRFGFTLPDPEIIADPKYAYYNCYSQFPTLIPSVFTNLGGSGNPVTINGVQANASNATIAVQSLPSFLTFNADGTITVASNAPAFIEEELYIKICTLGGNTCTPIINYHITRNNTCRTAAETAIRIQPNPSKDTFVVNFGEVKNEIQIEVYDFYGKLYLKTQATKLDTYPINAGNYPKGTYVLKIVDEKGVVTKKLVRE